MQEIPHLHYSISATTRPPRKGEADGKDYYFLPEEEFLNKIKRGEFLEWAKVYGNYYGTPVGKVRDCIKQGKDVLLEIDIEGALQVRKKFPEGVFIFIRPPSLKELEKRLRGRGKDSQEAIARRLQEAEKELRRISEYDYLIVNDEISQAIEEMKSVIKAEKCLVRRIFKGRREG